MLSYFLFDYCQCLARLAIAHLDLASDRQSFLLYRQQFALDRQDVTLKRLASCQLNADLVFNLAEPDGGKKSPLCKQLVSLEPVAGRAHLRVLQSHLLLAAGYFTFDRALARRKRFRSLVQIINLQLTRLAQLDAARPQRRPNARINGAAAVGALGGKREHRLAGCHQTTVADERLGNTAELRRHHLDAASGGDQHPCHAHLARVLAEVKEQAERRHDGSRHPRSDLDGDGSR